MNGRGAILLGLLVLLCQPMFPCSCVSTTMPSADFGASVVFRGTVTERKTLAGRTEMRGHGRYAITFRVDEYWKGPKQRTIILYGLDDGTDCLGGSSYQVGTEYLVFASERPSKDVFLGGAFWYGWTDVIPDGTPMLMDTECAPSGKISELFVMDAIKRLGKGRSPVSN
jgi:hypothetical protein